jgi:hypothetical protein
VHVPVIVIGSEMKVVSTDRGLGVSFPVGGGVLVTAETKFRTQGLVVLEHVKTGCRLKIEIVHESLTSDSGLLHKRVGFRQDLLFYACLIAMFVGLFFIVVRIADRTL